MSFDQAREAFASVAGLIDVRIVELGGTPVLHALAAADHDWPATAAALARSYWFDAFRADDPAANVHAATERERAYDADAAVAAARRAAWGELGRTEPRLLAERHVLAALERLVASRGIVWDPRLDELDPIAGALRTFWTTVAPELPHDPGPATPRGAGNVDRPHDHPEPPPPPTTTTLAAAVRHALALAEVPPPPALAAAYAVVTVPDARAWALQLVWQRVREQCRAAGEHATRIANTARVAARRDAYRELARQCTDLVAAAELLATR